MTKWMLEIKEIGTNGRLIFRNSFKARGRKHANKISEMVLDGLHSGEVIRSLGWSMWEVN